MYIFSKYNKIDIIYLALSKPTIPREKCGNYFIGHTPLLFGESEEESSPFSI